MHIHCNRSPDKASEMKDMDAKINICFFLRTLSTLPSPILLTLLLGLQECDGLFRLRALHLRLLDHRHDSRSQSCPEL